MKIFELLYFNREFLARLSAAGIKIDDYKYLDLYREYKQMCARSAKIAYIVAVLSEKYSISERQVYKIIKHMDATAIIVQ